MARRPLASFSCTFFVDEKIIFEKTRLLKSEFVFQYLLNPQTGYFYVNFVITLALTVLIIWFFPKWITRPAYRRQEYDVSQNEIIRIRQQIALRKEQKALSEVEIQLNKTKEEQVEQEKKFEATKTQEEKWEEEFSKMKKNDLFYGFIKLANAIYQDGGEMYSHQLEDKVQDGSKFLAYAATRGLVDTGGKSNGVSFLQLTDKGKYFYRLFSDSDMITLD